MAPNVIDVVVDEHIRALRELAVRSRRTRASRRRWWRVAASRRASARARGRDGAARHEDDVVVAAPMPASRDEAVA